MRSFWVISLLSTAALGQNVRLSNDNGISGYSSVYTMATGIAYTDAILSECSIARGRQNEPSAGVDPRDARVILGSANDYCGALAGLIWLGYYRSEDGGATFRSSLVPGYPGDASPYAALSQARTATSGDPVIAWDRHGRVYFGSESSGDPAGTKKTFGDVWVARFDNPDGTGGDTLNDGKRYLGTELVAQGSSAPNLLGVFNDKTAIEADRTGGACDANVYFAWARFSGAAGDASIFFSRSTDLGAAWSQPVKLTASIGLVQDPDIAVTGNGHVYVTFQRYATRNDPDAVMYVKSVDCGRTFSQPAVLTPFVRHRAVDVADPQPVPQRVLDDPNFEEEVAAPGSLTRNCGDFNNHCRSGYTFFRRDTSPRSTADPFDAEGEWVYVVYEATKPGTMVDTGTTFGSIVPGVGGQAGVYFARLDGATGAVTSPVPIDDQGSGHQFFPDISADEGVLHVLWWDSRNDPSYSPARPIGNDAAGVTGPALDVFYSNSTNRGSTWSGSTLLTTAKSNPNYEQFDNRSLPFAGDYLWITSIGNVAFGAWTDWRNTVAGTDPREGPTTDQADVKQCRTQSATGVWSADSCPHDGGIDQNIYGKRLP